MLSVMLCGESDTSLISQSFKDEILAFGGDPWHYQSGRIKYSNSAHSDWAINYQASVRSADLCVFVLIQNIGEITWTSELNESLVSGKPFLVFCLRETFNKYLLLNRSVNDLSVAKRAFCEPLARSYESHPRGLQSQSRAERATFARRWLSGLLDT